MKLVLLGTNVLVPSEEGGQTACYMLPEQGIVLDAGTGLYRLAQHLQTSSLDIYLTHAHGDHTRGLFHLRGAVLGNLLFRSGHKEIDGKPRSTCFCQKTNYPL